MKPAKRMTDAELLIATGRRWNVRSLEGREHPVLMRYAREHANYQARVHAQGHQLWGRRKYEIQSDLGGRFNVEECANESWPRQDRYKAAWEMYHSWRQSPGHWSEVNGPCELYGYAMVLSDSGIWYADALFAHKR